MPLFVLFLVRLLCCLGLALSCFCLISGENGTWGRLYYKAQILKVHLDMQTYDVEFHVGFGEGEFLNGVPAEMVRKVTGILPFFLMPRCVPLQSSTYIGKMVDAKLLGPKPYWWDRLLVLVGLKEKPGFQFGKGKGANFIASLEDIERRHAYILQCLNEGMKDNIIVFRI
jgi:hypothetical protein